MARIRGRNLTPSSGLHTHNIHVHAIAHANTNTYMHTLPCKRTFSSQQMQLFQLYGNNKWVRSCVSLSQASRRSGSSDRICLTVPRGSAYHRSSPSPSLLNLWREQLQSRASPRQPGSHLFLRIQPWSFFVPVPSARGPLVWRVHTLL